MTRGNSVTLYDVSVLPSLIAVFGLPGLLLVAIVVLIVLSVRMTRKAADKRREEEASKEEYPDPDEPADSRRDQ